jgi:hypothetical protein
MCYEAYHSGMLFILQQAFARTKYEEKRKHEAEANVFEGSFCLQKRHIESEAEDCRINSCLRLTVKPCYARAVCVSLIIYFMYSNTV